MKVLIRHRERANGQRNLFRHRLIPRGLKWNFNLTRSHQVIPCEKLSSEKIKFSPTNPISATEGFRFVKEFQLKVRYVIYIYLYKKETLRAQDANYIERP